MKLALALLLAGATASAHAGVSCKIGGTSIDAAGSLADFNYSPSGKAGRTGRVSLFRLMTRDNGDGPSSGVDLKAVDITRAGDYPVVDEAGWRSSIRVKGKRQRITSGQFRFTQFEMRDTTGRAVGTVEFTTEQTSGSCSFDVEVQGINRDRLGL